MGKTMDLLNRMTAMGITAVEAHWILGRLAVDTPNKLAEALDALEAKRQKVTADGRAAA